MRRKRVTVPSPIADEVMYSADLLCCICEDRGDHIHHLDEDPSNNSIENLVLLCFRHHDEVTKRGGLSRKLSPGVIESYRRDLHRKVEARRTLPSLGGLSDDGEINTEERLFQLMMDAVLIRDINEIRWNRPRDGDEDATLDVVHKLAIFTNLSGLRARKAICAGLDDISSETRQGCTRRIARSIGNATYEALPIRNRWHRDETPISDVEFDLFMYGLEIGLGLSYDGGLYLQDIEVVDAGAELLWKVLQYAVIKEHEALKEATLREFETAIDGATRGGDEVILELVTLYRDHGLTGDWHNPKYGERILGRFE